VKVPREIVAEELLISLGFNPIEYIITRNGNIITEKDILRDGDILILYPVVSGGRVRA